MMTTGYDCTDILNLGLFRPIFSPTDFVQIKGRGTRRHSFLDQLRDERQKEEVAQSEKTEFKLFDFFGNYEYFETEFDYDQVLKLPVSSGERRPDMGRHGARWPLSAPTSTWAVTISRHSAKRRSDPRGLKIDRMLFEKFAETVRENETVAEAVEAGQWDRVIDYVNSELMDKPEEFYTLDNLRKAAAVDRRVTLREILERVFGLIPGFKSKDELLEEEFDKFVTDHKPEEAQSIPAIKAYFKAYVTSDLTRHIVDAKLFPDLATNAVFSFGDFRAVPKKYRTLVPEYVKDYVSLNQFAA